MMDFVIIVIIANFAIQILKDYNILLDTKYNHVINIKNPDPLYAKEEKLAHFIMTMMIKDHRRVI